MKIRTAGDPNGIRTNRHQNKRLEGCSFTSEIGRQEITESTLSKCDIQYIDS
jgi:hypothetical protein